MFCFFAIVNGDGKKKAFFGVIVSFCQKTSRHEGRTDKNKLIGSPKWNNFIVAVHTNRRQVKLNKDLEGKKDLISSHKQSKI